MNILIVTKHPTHPTTGGSRYGILAQANLLKQLGHDVHYLYIHEKPLRKIHAQVVNREEMLSYWTHRYHQYDIPLYEKCYNVVKEKVRKYLCHYTWRCDDDYPWQLHKVINRLDVAYHFDCCIVNYYFLTKALTKINIPKKVLFTHDCFSYRNIVVGKQCWRSIKPNCEAKAMQRSPYILAVQDEEAIFIKKLSPKSKVYTIYGIYDFFPTDFVYNRNMLFFSGAGESNIEGLNWFVESVFPLIVNAFPDVKLIIGGYICKKLTLYNKHPNIQLYGVVDNAIDFFRLGDVAINPTRLGTGIKIKTFESLSYGKIVMTHPNVIEGIYHKESAPLFASDKPEEWKNFLLKLWDNENRTLLKYYRDETEIYMGDMKKYIVKQYEKLLRD